MSDDSHINLLYWTSIFCRPGPNIVQRVYILSIPDNSILGFHVTSRRPMLVYRTIAQKVFWDFDSIILKNLSDALPLPRKPMWPSHHGCENQE